MSFINEFHKIIFHLIDRFLFLLSIFFPSFNQMEISLVPFKKKFVSKIDTVFISTNLMETIHIELMILVKNTCLTKDYNFPCLKN